MWEEIEAKGQRFLELQKILEDPASPGKPQYAGWLREHGRLTKFGEVYSEYAKAKASASEAAAMVKDPSTDAEMRELAQEELVTEKAKAEKLRDQMIEAAQGEDEDADRNVIVEIHSGTGGDEAALFVGDLFEMYSRYAAKKGWNLQAIDTSPGKMGGYTQIQFRVEGSGAFGEFRFEAGGHRVQRVPITETQGRVQTSMARVAVLPEAEEVEVNVDPKDVKISFCAAGGPGGQNVNKVASQAQLQHLPTGLIVHCTETRSQKQNLERAWQILRSKLFALEKAKLEKNRSDERLGQIGSGERSARIRTYNFPQGRCTDHRLTGDFKNWPVAKIAAGEMDGLIAKLIEVRKKGGAVTEDDED